MRLKQYLKELYLMSFTPQGSELGRGLYIEIFINPSKKELMDASKVGQNLGFDPSGKNVRFLLDISTKKVYAWSPNVTHHTAWPQLKKEVKKIGMLADRTILTGIANFQKGRFEMVDSDIGIMHNFKSYPPEKWKFADKYILVTPYLSKEYKRMKEMGSI